LNCNAPCGRQSFSHDGSAIVEPLATCLEPGRLDIYRTTIFSGLTRALRLAFPAVERPVGGEFFAGAADAFIREYLPRVAYLDLYGGGFPDFLSRFPPAISLPYLADVARLDWAVNRALHAPDDTPLDLSQLAALAPDDQDRVRFRAHSSVGSLRSDFAVNDIWRAVLKGDDQALADLDLASGRPSCWSSVAKPASRFRRSSSLSLPRQCMHVRALPPGDGRSEEGKSLLYGLTDLTKSDLGCSGSCGVITVISPSLTHSCTLSATHLGAHMRETRINMIDALRGQQEQLKRLLAQKALISDATQSDLSAIVAQIIEIKRLIAEFEKIIQDQLQRRE
jgi:hypothetical protein